MASQKQKSASSLRRGSHHKKGNRYLKVYWPYVPMVLIVALGLFLGNWQPGQTRGVLAYATDVNIQSLLDYTNEQRSKYGREPLTMNNKLSLAAQRKANDMTTKNYWSHTSPDGTEPWAFIQGSDYEYLKAGENLAYGFSSSKDTVGGWMNSTSHRENMLDNVYTEVGFGFANAQNFNNSGPETVVVAMYGQPPTAPTTAASQQNNQTNGVAVNTETNIIDQEPVSVARVQAWTSGQAPWAMLAIGLASGAALAWMIAKHGLALRRLVVEGEEFIVHHPMLDITLISIVMVGYVLSRGIGVIR